MDNNLMDRHLHKASLNTQCLSTKAIHLNLPICHLLWAIRCRYLHNNSSNSNSNSLRYLSVVNLLSTTFTGAILHQLKQSSQPNSMLTMLNCNNRSKLNENPISHKSLHRLMHVYHKRAISSNSNHLLSFQDNHLILIRSVANPIAYRRNEKSRTRNAGLGNKERP